MTECAECLSALSTVRLSEVTAGSAIALHAARCPMCMQVVEEVRQAEYRLGLGLNEAATLRTSKDLAWAAIDGAEFRRRQIIARWVRGGLAIAGLAVFGIFMESRVGSNSSQRPILNVVTLRLRCLTPAAAAELVTPYLRSSGSVVYRVDDVHAITLKARPREIAIATSQIDQFDDPKSCTLPTPALAGSASGTVTNDPALAQAIDQAIARGRNPTSNAPDAPVVTRTRKVETVRIPSRR